MNKDFWEARYDEGGHAYGEKPNEFLVSLKDVFKKGESALVIGDGEGRNGVWLAEQGLEVLSIDQSEVGLKKAQEMAESRSVSIKMECADLIHWHWPENQYDYVVIIYVHFSPDVRPKIHQKALSALKPGGKLILEGFTYEQLNYSSGGPPVREMLYDSTLLEKDFKAGHIKYMEELIIILDEGKYHSGQGAIIRAIIEPPK